MHISDCTIRTVVKIVDHEKTVCDFLTGVIDGHVVVQEGNLALQLVVIKLDIPVMIHYRNSSRILANPSYLREVHPKEIG